MYLLPSKTNISTYLYLMVSLLLSTLQIIKLATLDNILLENVSQFDDFVLIMDISLSDHYPILFNCLISGSLSKSTSLASSYCFNSAKQISSFILSLPNFTFTGFASSTNSDSFYSHLKFIIPQSFTQKTKNSLE